MEGCIRVLLAAATHPNITVVGKVTARVRGQCKCPWLVGDLGSELLPSCGSARLQGTQRLCMQPADGGVRVGGF